MTKFIVGYGWGADVDIIEAACLDDAKAEAINRSVAVGVDSEGIDDCSWAKEYDPDLALELGLLHEPEVSGLMQAFKEADKRRTP